MSTAPEQVSELAIAVAKRCDAASSALLEDFARQVVVLQLWMKYLHSSVTTADAEPILTGARSSLVEVAAFICLGLVRPATVLMRTEIELLMAWLYFNDHTIEWRYSRENGDRYPLYTQIWKYLSGYNKRFEQRFDLLGRSKIRTLKEPYGLLSIHVHALTSPALPSAGTLSSVVADVELCKECIRLQGEVAEFLTDILFAWFAVRWADFPPELMDYIKERLEADKIKELFR